MQKKWNGRTVYLSKKTMAILAIAALALALIPLLLIARYNHSCADDFAYGITTAHAWQTTGSLRQVLSMAYNRSAVSYTGWQGSYASTFLMALQPAVFGEGFYSVVPYIMLTCLIGGTLFFLKVVLINYCGADRWSYWLIGCAVLLLSISFLPSPVEGLFWFNGSVYYTFFYSVGLVLLGLLLLYLKSERRSAWVWYILPSIVLSLLIGGGNYTTALLTTVVLALLTAVLALRKNRKAWAVLLVFAAAAAGFLFSVCAPGNAVRQATIEGGPGAVVSVIQSFRYGATYACRWANWPVLAALGVLTPFIYGTARRTRFSFSYPLVAILLCYCFFSAAFTPPIYAMNNPGPNRLQNIIYFQFLLSLLFCAFYLCGWVARRVESAAQEGAADMRRLQHVFLQLSRRCGIWLLAAALVIFVAGCLALPDWRHITSISAATSLKNGEARQYHEEVLQRLAVYEDETVTQVEFRPYTVYPYVLFFDDLGETMNDWRNDNVAKYFQKESVILRP